MSIPRIARYTWSRQWHAVGLIGVSVGVFSVTPFLIKRSLGASAWDVALLIAIWQAPWILAPAVEPLVARLHPQKVWRWMAVLAHAPLLAIAFLPMATPLMIAMGLYYLVSNAYIPHRGALIRTNYPPQVRGRMYSFMQAVTLLGMTLAAKGAGWLMDADGFWVRVLYPAAAVAGFFGFWLHGRIRWRRRRQAQARRANTSWRDVWTILKTDRAFRTYEIGFMTYGVAFLSGWALLSLYAEGPLNLSYDQFTNATGYAFPIALVVGAWCMGKFTDRLGVVRMSALAVISLAVFYLSMLLVRGPLSFVAAYALFGFSMAAIDVGWSLGPLHFAPEGKAHMYTAVHFALVGVRSLFAPFLGLLLMSNLGYDVAFACCATLLLVASLILWRLSRSSQ